MINETLILAPATSHFTPKTGLCNGGDGTNTKYQLFISLAWCEVMCLSVMRSDEN